MHDRREAVEGLTLVRRTAWVSADGAYWCTRRRDGWLILPNGEESGVSLLELGLAGRPIDLPLPRLREAIETATGRSFRLKASRTSYEVEGTDLVVSRLGRSSRPAWIVSGRGSTRRWDYEGVDRWPTRRAACAAIARFLESIDGPHPLAGDGPLASDVSFPSGSSATWR